MSSKHGIQVRLLVRVQIRLRSTAEVQLSPKEQIVSSNPTGVSNS